MERMFNHLKQMRRIATRYDKTTLFFISFLNLAAARFCVRSFVKMTQRLKHCFAGLSPSISGWGKIGRSDLHDDLRDTNRADKQFCL
nr:hypothetical protein [Gluconobacter oxydans]